jgi:uncharacterized membrane protein
MEATLSTITGCAAVGVEAAAVLLIAYGAADAFVKVAGHILGGRSPAGWRKEVFVRFGVWLLLGLQFELAADVLHSIIAPTWNQIGQLGAIAAIRTFLNYFLEKDIEGAADRDAPQSVRV